MLRAIKPVTRHKARRLEPGVNECERNTIDSVCWTLTVKDVTLFYINEICVITHIHTDNRINPI